MAESVETENGRRSDLAEDSSAERSAWRRDSADHDISARLGQRIRQHRESLGVSLNVASKLTGVPAATLSRIENNRMAPTMPVVLKLMTGLRLTWPSLMAGIPPEMHEAQISIAHLGEGEHVEVQDNIYTIPHTESSLCNQMQPVIFDIGSKTVEEAGGLLGHHGTELCYVLSGTLMMHFVNRQPVELAVGASALFNAEIPHAYVSKGRGRTRVLMLHSVDPLIRDPSEFMPLLSVLRRNAIEMSDQ
jgi:transcriptional regulator with XRE-family HTH domain